MSALPNGWLPDEEAEQLQRLADGCVVLELGAWKGRSTVAMSRTAAYVVSVDRHQGIKGVDGGDSLAEYLHVIRSLPNVAMVVASFSDFVPLLGRVFDLVFIDGDHDADSVQRDIRLAHAHVRDGGTLAFHDWDFASVRRGAAREKLRRPTGLVGSLAWFAAKAEA